MNKYWSPRLDGIEPYIPGEQPKDKKYIKLNTNENPYPPSPKALSAMKEAACEDIRLYPDPSCDMLRNVIADNFALKTEQIFIGNGSDEILAFSFMAFFDPEKTILFPDISYSFYPVYAKFFGLKYETVKITDDFDIPVEGFCKHNGGIVIPNPNAPTGKSLEIEKIIKILDANPDAVVVIDEAYVDFGTESAVQLIDKYPNLLVVQTLSKSRSLAGLRVGFAMGNKELIDALYCVKDSINSYTIDRCAMQGAAAAIKDREYFEATCRKVIKTREKFSEEMGNLGFKVIKSGANFVFASHVSMPARVLFKKLRDKGVLVRYFDKPRIDNYLRISIGTDEDMAYMLEKIKEIIK